jgi:acetylornithine deacetylase/succinyl-diaminopimelate desuccinylase-like protein
VPDVTVSLASRLRGHVERLAGEIGERHVLRPPALHAAERYIADTLRALGYAVARQNYEAQGVDCANLEVAIEGSARASEIVLAGAHYDTVPGSPGADDNASGVAAVLELARLLREAGPARGRSSSWPSSTRNRPSSSGVRWGARSTRAPREREAMTSA